MAVLLYIPTGDLALTGDINGMATGGSYVVVEGIQQIRQRLSARLKFFLGEWFIDLRQGLPYFRPGFLGKSPNPNLIRSLMRRVILDTPGVLSCTKLTLDIDSATRRGRLSFQAICDGGTIVVKPGDEDFILEDMPAAA